MQKRTERILWIGAGITVLGGITALAFAADRDPGDDLEPPDVDDGGSGGGSVLGPMDIDPGDVGGSGGGGGGGSVIGPVTFPTPEPPPLPPVGPPVGTVDMGEWTRTYPTPSAFYQVKRGDMGLGTDSDHSIAYRALLSAGYLAARTIGNVSTDEARRYGLDVGARARDAAQRRLQYWQIVQCSGFNDVAFGTYGFGNQAVEAPSGRALRLLPYHTDAKAALGRGLPVRRNIGIQTGQKIGSGNKFEFLWLPGLDLVALWERMELVPDQWNPPIPWSIETTEPLAGMTFGCRGGAIVL